MTLIEKEIDENYEGFHADWTKQIQSNWDSLKGNSVFKESYRRIAVINGLKTSLILPSYSSGSAAFFLEAHNDALISHVNASFGSWRSALQSLRSVIENTLCCVYYKDHPIELSLWEKGEFRIGFTELFKYLCKHPLISDIGESASGLELIKTEYATLSKAVHASATDFRMTKKSSSILLWNTEKSHAGMWGTRERKVLEGISLLLCCIHRDALSGTKNPGLRASLHYTISKGKRAELKARFSITVTEP